MEDTTPTMHLVDSLWNNLWFQNSLRHYIALHNTAQVRQQHLIDAWTKRSPIVRLFVKCPERPLHEIRIVRDQQLAAFLLAYPVYEKFFDSPRELEPCEMHQVCKHFVHFIATGRDM